MLLQEFFQHSFLLHVLPDGLSFLQNDSAHNEKILGL